MWGYHWLWAFIGYSISGLTLIELSIYAAIIAFCLLVVAWYLYRVKRGEKILNQKIEDAKKAGIHEPVSLHPEINYDICIGSGACVLACPEKDILGLANGRGYIVNGAECIGHGACFHACPVEAISLVLGTEKRGVELPHINHNYESNVQGIFIAGELGGMGLIRNCVEQGMVAMEEIVKSGYLSDHQRDYDCVIVGAGPAGISAALTAKKHGLRFQLVDQDTLGGTVYSFPRVKLVMTQPMYLPLYGHVKLYETNKDELLRIWREALGKNNITVREKFRVVDVRHEEGGFRVISAEGEELSTRTVLLAIGRRGTPRKLGVPGEEGSDKVFYRLLDPELIEGKNILVVGGGDSALEASLMLMDQNTVYHSYRRDAIARAKPKNRQKFYHAIEEGKIRILWNTNVTEIRPTEVQLINNKTQETIAVPNDLVYVFIGGVLPNAFLEKIGIKILKRFRYTVKTYRN